MRRIATERARWVAIRDDEEDRRRYAAQDVIAMIDRVVDVVKQRDDAIAAEHDALQRLDQWAEEAHSAAAERDQAFQALGRVRDLMDLWEMEAIDQDDRDTVALVRNALDGKQ
ncbi:hypothetical protein CH275_05000 [Rhodococcus sp. 06-235-1A]|uniref:hypothetical protein n=1 Tax=Rhodococcus sp. 06-235-1A TaxID=2022508 RepID=UPI000B9B9712|nr:hypothetical protein [Rhodococcus sp. 06-235-1A]OZD08508.1 hypothetical protein CH275_05000 [Rhodococcus sp. 06-235-1A]